MTTADVLRDARALIEDPANFWQSGNGDPGVPGQRCASIALEEASGYVGGDPFSVLVQAIGAADVVESGEVDLLTAIYDYNDSHGHVEVLAAFDRAIVLAERTA